MIELKNIGVTFQQNKQDFQAVKNVNLTIEEGEIFGIVGPSGAGKSTLVRVINLLQPPTAGQVLIEGNEITSLKRKELCKVRLDIGMIFQHFNLISGSTIAGKCGVCPSCKPLSERENTGKSERTPRNGTSAGKSGFLSGQLKRRAETESGNR